MASQSVVGSEAGPRQLRGLGVAQGQRGPSRAAALLLLLLMMMGVMTMGQVQGPCSVNSRPAAQLMVTGQQQGGLTGPRAGEHESKDRAGSRYRGTGAGWRQRCLCAQDQQAAQCVPVMQHEFIILQQQQQQQFVSHMNVPATWPFTPGSGPPCEGPTWGSRSLTASCSWLSWQQLPRRRPGKCGG